MREIFLRKCDQFGPQCRATKGVHKIAVFVTWRLPDSEKNGLKRFTTTPGFLSTQKEAIIRPKGGNVKCFEEEEEEAKKAVGVGA